MASIISKLTADPSVCGIFTDFDGTLAPIAPNPEDAAALPGAREILEQLAQTYRLVGIVSGRAMDALSQRICPEGVILAASYGCQRSDRVVGHPDTSFWDPVARRASDSLGAIDGVVVEQKQLGVGLHYRMNPDAATEVNRVADELSDEFGLQIRPGRMVAELTLPGPGKADTIEQMIKEFGLRTAAFAGDDLADLEAFARMRELDVEAVLIAVVGRESPPALAEMADYICDGPHEYLDLLRRLVAATGPRLD